MKRAQYSGRPRGAAFMLASQHDFLDCCASQGEHRFDCAVEPERSKRGGGPFLPVRLVG